MSRRFTFKEFWREKKKILNSSQQIQGDAGPHHSIQEEDQKGQNNQEGEDGTSQYESEVFLASNPLPIRSDDKTQDPTKIAAQELWRAAFSNLELQNVDLMKKFKELMMTELNGMGHSKPMDLNAQDDWDIMEMFISRQTAGVLDPKQIRLYSGLDQAFRILRGIIEMINEPIKHVPQAAAPWAGVNIAVTLMSLPVTERKANLDGAQRILEKLRWYQGLAGYLFQDYEEELSVSRQRELLREKMIDYFQKLLLYQIRSILLLHTNSILATFRGAVKVDEWERHMKEIQTVETELDNRIEQFERIKEREEQSQLQTDTIRNACLNALEVSNPKYDRKRILRDKGGLVPSCCDWIRPQQASEKGIFLDWLNDPEQNIFWITGKAGKGKTMLMCDLIQWLEDTSHNKLLFYFFCEISRTQTTDYNAAAIRGLIYAIVSENRQLAHYIQAEWDKNNNLFKDANVQLTSYEILKAILSDDLMESATIFIDALDECGADLDLLFEIIKSTPTVKWVISSRSNTSFVDEQLFNIAQCRNISLDDLGDVVSEAVTLYIKKQVQDLRQMKRYEEGISREIELYLTTQSEGTFLWAALACRELWDPDTDDNDALQVLKSLPRGLSSMYERMMKKVQAANKERRKLFEVILSISLVVSRSITLDEFFRLASSSQNFNLFRNIQHLRQMVEKCGHFFTISDSDPESLSSGSKIDFVHKSAKDYLLEKRMENVPLPRINYDIFKQCIKQMRGHLKRDMLSLKHPGAVAPKEHYGLKRLNSIAYACTSWAEHIKCAGHADNTCNEYETLIGNFLRKHFLHWIEALSLLGKLPVGASALYNIKIFTDSHGMKQLSEFVMDAYRFFLAFQSPIEQYPLQVYASALLFSPSGSHIKTTFAEIVPKWATIRYGLKDRWPPHLCAIGDLLPRRKVRYSVDGRKLISASNTDVDIRDTITFGCLQQFYAQKNFSQTVSEFELSIDCTKAAWAYHKPGLIKILDIAHGTWVDIPKKDGRADKLIFSKSGDRLASHSFFDDYLAVWDTSNGSLHCRIPVLSKSELSFCFLGDSANLALAWKEIGEPIQIWYTGSGQLKDQIQTGSGICVKQLEPFLNNSSRILSLSDNGDVKILDTVLKQSVCEFSSLSITVTSASISPNSELVVLFANSDEVHIWDLGEQTSFQLEGRYAGAEVFSNDSKLLAIQTPVEFEIWIWDITSRTVVCKINEWNATIGSMAFSPDGRFLALHTYSGYMKIWNISDNNLELVGKAEGKVNANIRISLISFSRDGKWLAIVSQNESEIQLWDKTGAFVRILANGKGIKSIAFSWDGTKLAFGTSDGNVGVTNVARESPVEIVFSTTPNLGAIRAPVTKLEFSRDDSHLAIVQTSIMSFLDLETGQYCRAEAPKRSYSYSEREHPYICAVKFYENSLAFSILENGSIRMWDPITGICLKEIPEEPPGIVWGQRFCAIDVRLFQGSLQIISTSSTRNGALYIIDVDTGKRIRTFKHEWLEALEFGQENDTVLYSDRGNVNLEQFDLGLDQDASQEETVMYQGYGVRGYWVTKDERPILWMPSEYYRLRGGCAISKSQIAIVCQSGHLLFLDFNEEHMSF